MHKAIDTVKIGFLGGGNMTTALIAGLVSPASSFSADQIIVYDRNQHKNQSLRMEYGVGSSDSVKALIAASDVLVISVKPQAVKTVLLELCSDIAQAAPLIISVAAGITTESMLRWLEHPHSIVRAMPNTPSTIEQGATGLYASEQTTDEQKEIAEAILSAVGRISWVRSDADIDTVTALSGSGPAYFLLLLQAMINAAKDAGMNEDAAQALALQTCQGTAMLARESDKSIQTLIDDITSPKGTTEQAILSFKNAGLSDIVTNAFEAARLRAKALSDEFGN
ncbi:MAG: pyrroline-5-carboxylate reductase [Pseudomonadota bacterium]